MSFLLLKQRGVRMSASLKSGKGRARLLRNVLYGLPVLILVVWVLDYVMLIVRMRTSLAPGEIVLEGFPYSTGVATAAGVDCLFWKTEKALFPCQYQVRNSETGACVVRLNSSRKIYKVRRVQQGFWQRSLADSAGGINKRKKRVVETEESKRWLLRRDLCICTCMC